MVVRYVVAHHIEKQNGLSRVRKRRTYILYYIILYYITFSGH
jgi:hypothetical protein